MSDLAYFGERWEAAAHAPRVDTPAGMACAYCSEPVRLGEQGVMLAGEYGDPRPFHRECELRMRLGGIGHLNGCCRCHGGLEDPDPPGLTRRQAARLVLEHADRVSAA